MSHIQQFQFGTDLTVALLWQYNQAQRLETLITLKNSWYDENQRAFWENWYRDVFNLDTANQFGLNVWARILGIPLVVSTPPQTDPKWGFDPNHPNFGRGNFAPSADGVIMLDTEQARLVLKLRAFQIITRGDVLSVGAFLSQLFAPMGEVRVLDGLDMTVTYVFLFVPPASIMFVLRRFDLLPRPEGVEAKILVNPADSWGFAPHHPNFGRGNFAPGG